MKKLIFVLLLAGVGVGSAYACLQHKKEEVLSKRVIVPKIAAVKNNKSTHPYRHYKAEGKASWYGPGFHGRKTASGERFNRRALTAAHKTLPLGTKVKVTNKDTKKSVIVRINDRGPYVSGRLIDLSEGAAKSIGIKKEGVARVKLASIR